MTRHEGGRRITRKSLAAWLLAAAVAFAGIGVGLHAAWESRFGPLAQLSRDWGVRFPAGSVVTEHESDQGFDGDGYSYTVIRMRTGVDVDGTVLDDDNYRTGALTAGQSAAITQAADALRSTAPIDVTALSGRPHYLTSRTRSFPVPAGDEPYSETDTLLIVRDGDGVYRIFESF